MDEKVKQAQNTTPKVFSHTVSRMGGRTALAIQGIGAMA